MIKRDSLYTFIRASHKEYVMSTTNNNVSTTVVAFFAGAVIGAAAALLLTPVSGRELCGKLADLGENSADKVQRLAREAKFRATPKSSYADYQYDGGDAWI
jgi:gas vesicle protein